MLSTLAHTCIAISIASHPLAQGKSKVIKAHSGPVRSVCFSPDGTSLVSASDDKNCKIWSVPQYRFLCSLSGHTNWVRSAVFSPDGRMVASASEDKTVKLWDLRTHECAHSYFDHGRCVCVQRLCSMRA